MNEDDLEKLATEILIADRKDQGDVFGFFTVDQYELRLRKEVYSAHPIDPLHFSGLYRRAWSGRLANDRPTKRTTRRADPWSQEYFESGGDSVPGVWIPSARREDVVSGQHYVPGLTRDPLFPACAPLGHLDRCQRSRIRAALRSGQPMDRLARHYGVPLGVIQRLREQMSAPSGSLLVESIQIKEGDKHG